MKNSGVKNKIIFFGNGPLAEYALAVLMRECQVVFHAHDKADLEEVVTLKKADPSLIGVLASFGVLIPSSVLEVFEPEGILNIHPSFLPLYRGASPIESAILDGASEFGVSVMKLVKAMDAGPIYAQATLSDVPEGVSKDFLYRNLAEMGASMVLSLLKTVAKTGKWPEPTLQNDAKATYCSKFEKKDGILSPNADTAEVTLRKILAFQSFPKAKYTFFGVRCIILEAHMCKPGETAVLPLACADGQILSIDRLQPEGGRPMDAKSFLNGYKK